MTDKWKLDPGGFLPFLNLLRDNSDVHCLLLKQSKGGMVSSFGMSLLEDILSDMRIANAV